VTSTSLSSGAALDKPGISSGAAEKAALIAGVSLFLGFCFDYLFYDKALGVNFPLYNSFIVAGLLIIAKRTKSVLPSQVFLLLIPLIFFIVMVSVRTSLLLTFLNVIASLAILLMIAEVTVGTKVYGFLVSDYMRMCLLPLKFFRSCYESLSVLSRVGVAIANKNIILQILKGIIMSVPVLLLFLLLFSSADLIFQKHLVNLVNFNINPEIIFRLFLILVVAIILTGAFSYTFREIPTDGIPEQKSSDAYRLGHIELSILLGSVNILFFVFILIQLTYLFGGQSNISSQGFTYAEYARRGFFELIAVAVFSFLLLWATEKYVVKLASGHGFLFKVLGTGLIVQVMLIMVSAFKRLLLYEQAYGFTTLRLYSHAFIIFQAVVFLSLLHKFLKDDREKVFVFRSFIAAIIFLAAMNLLNPDAFIARHNIRRFSATGKLDVVYLSRLSDDAVPETTKLLDMVNSRTRIIVVENLQSMQKRRNSDFFSRWQSLNLSRLRAQKACQFLIP
jgi:hypothetical protein